MVRLYLSIEFLTTFGVEFVVLWYNKRIYVKMAKSVFFNGCDKYGF
jgi:hypothetical protein